MKILHYTSVRRKTSSAFLWLVVTSRDQLQSAGEYWFEADRTLYIYIYTGKVSFSWGGGCLCIHSVNAHTYTKGRQIRRKHLGPSLCVYTHEMYLNLYVAQGQYVERPPVAACLTHSQMNWILPIRKVKTRENGTHAHRWKTKVLADTSIKLWPNAYDISPPHKVKLGRKMDNRMVNTTGQKRTIRPLHYYQCRVLLVPIEFALKLERDGETAGISSKSWAPESVRRPFNQRLTIPASAGTPRPATTKAQQERRRSVLYFIFFLSSLFLLSPWQRLQATLGWTRLFKSWTHWSRDEATTTTIETRELARTQ